jgi:hypothetical protein
MTLQVWQEQLTRYVQAKTDNALQASPQILTSTYGQKRMETYRGNYTSGLVNMLFISYPQVAKLVGNSCFTQLASDFVKQTSFTQDNIDQYGNTFPDFIEYCLTHHKALASVPYLADVARLDWICIQSYYAKPREIFQFDAFGQLSQQQQLLCKFNLVDDIYPLISVWPLVDLWRFYDQDLPLASISKGRGDPLVVQRPQYKPMVSAITKDDLLLLKDIAQGIALDDISQRDETALPRYIEQGWIGGFYL